MVFCDANCFLVGGVTKGHNHQQPDDKRQKKYKQQRRVGVEKAHLNEIEAGPIEVGWNEAPLTRCTPTLATASSQALSRGHFPHPAKALSWFPSPACATRIRPQTRSRRLRRTAALVPATRPQSSLCAMQTTFPPFPHL